MKGMRKVKRGRGFRGVLAYVFGRDDEHKGEPSLLLGGNLSGTDPRTLAQEFGMTRSLRPEIEKPVWHNSLRLPWGESITHAQWVKIADDYMNEMGFSDLHLRCYVLHDDDDGQHIHIVASRIALDGSLYLGKNENLESTRIIQALEVDHLLTITKGQEYDDGKIKMPDIKAPKKGEMEKGLRLGVKAPRLVLQDLLNEAMKEPQPIMQFVEFLEANGVGVVANLAATGKMNGFSFSYGGLSFKGSSLGDKYKWSRLSRVVDYAQDRDFEELAKRKSVVRNDIGNADGIAGITASDSRPDNRKSGADGGNGTSLGSRAGYPTGDHGATDCRGDAVIAGTNDQIDGQRNSPEGERFADGSSGSTDGQRRDTGAASTNDDVVLDGGDIHCHPLVDRDRDDSGNVTVTDWNSRFKKASAAKRRAKEQKQDSPDRLVEYQQVRDTAHMADLVAYMKSVGLEVKKDGVKNWIIDDRYRVTKQPDGHYVWCTWDHSRGGDAIAFCTDEMGLRFQQAIVDLSGSRLVPAQAKEWSPMDRFPTAPPICRNADPVRHYLEERGISHKTILRAQGAGFLRFVDYNGVPSAAFCGLGDNGQLRSMTVRLTQPIQSFDGEKQLTKIDVRHSNKAYPAIWDGDDPSFVWVVEGGMDALAIVEWHKAYQKPIPCIIVSGGAGVQSFLDQPHVQQRLKKAESVYVAMDHEKDPETQAKTDAAHARQIEKLCDLGCEKVIAWMPPVGSKDLAEAWKAGTLPDPHNLLAPMGETPQEGELEAPQEGEFIMEDEIHVAPAALETQTLQERLDLYDG
ncbi:relaxase/mobilization nuclease domain-containing protein [Acidithiobacillus sp. HP-6]|uniref:relaxase/mobilization nuclease domain-containing protein n=1 Tax=unclassified Acidithiobacillus TaxID=2614800 RepID=UPI001879C1D5|nr:MULTISPECIES: relaxase/mobilization nuclease domain-containing protein [unclassified Acidithiobacillus]MBE7564110.1 relaxase/mobilization nuclease domain-containing protein [Acidithiobacillus sp. HP-6]MBE7570811.1 relaxase/mobilization nuclease domain-containing protein [Acidithiobacillus sp. HP-2]